MFVKLTNQHGQDWYVRPERVAAVIPTVGIGPQIRSWVQVAVSEGYGMEVATSEYPEEVVRLLEGGAQDA